MESRIELSEEQYKDTLRAMREFVEKDPERDKEFTRINRVNLSFTDVLREVELRTEMGREFVLAFYYLQKNYSRSREI